MKSEKVSKWLKSIDRLIENQWPLLTSVFLHLGLFRISSMNFFMSSKICEKILFKEMLVKEAHAIMLTSCLLFHIQIRLTLLKAITLWGHRQSHHSSCQKYFKMILIFYLWNLCIFVIWHLYLLFNYMIFSIHLLFYERKYISFSC